LRVNCATTWRSDGVILLLISTVFTLENCYFVLIASFPLFGTRVLQNTKKDAIRLIVLNNKSKRFFDFWSIDKSTLF
jgi:hypothetical protein